MYGVVRRPSLSPGMKSKVFFGEEPLRVCSKATRRGVWL